MSEARFETAKHIMEVQKNLSIFIKELIDRGINHDASKLQSPEVEYFDKFTEDLKNYTYGTPEYAEQKKKNLQPALDHHYAHSRHHPEHYRNGINDMNLIDILEMFVDWYSSTKRSSDGNIRKSIEYNAERFKINSQLVKIFENTIEVLDK